MEQQGRLGIALSLWYLKQQYAARRCVPYIERFSRSSDFGYGALNHTKVASRSMKPKTPKVCATKSIGAAPILNAVASCAYHPFPGVETSAPFRVVIFHRPKRICRGKAP